MWARVGWNPPWKAGIAFIPIECVCVDASAVNRKAVDFATPAWVFGGFWAKVERLTALYGEASTRGMVESTWEEPAMQLVGVDFPTSPSGRTNRAEVQNELDMNPNRNHRN